MSDLCPHCNRVAQQVSEKCLYCGKPLDGAPEPSEAAKKPGGGPNGSKSAGGATRAEASPPRQLEVGGPAHQDESMLAAPPARVRSTRTPLTAARPTETPGFLQTTVGRVVIFVAALVMVVVAVATALQDSGDAGAAAEPAPASDPEELIAEGMMPDEATTPPDDVRAAAAGRREQLAQESLNTVAGWVQAYGAEYGHYPTYLGDRLSAVAQFASPAEVERVLSRFQDGRVEYERGVADTGDTETFRISAGVPGPGRRSVTAEGTRPRGGSPKNPAPLS